MCEKTVGTNYEVEYNRLREENEKLKAKIDYYRGMENECAMMRAQLDIVYLIFRGKNNG